MKLRKFEATAVNGFMDFNIEFNDQLTFLTGINGSGKTTVLNLIASFLSGRWDYLIFQEFKTLSLTFEDNESRKHKIIARMAGTSLNFQHEIDSQSNAYDIPKDDIFSFFNAFLNIDSTQNGHEISERVIRASKLYTFDIFQYIYELPNPMYLGVDRISDLPGLNYVPRRQRDISTLVDKFFIFNGNLKESLYDAIDFVESEIQDCYKEINKLDLKFRKEVSDVNNSDMIQGLVKKLEKREKEILQKINEFFDLINSYYHDSGKFLNYESNGEILYKSKDNVLRELSKLSSGEIQLIVIFAHLFFNEKTKNTSVFIVDEPELSLHLQWQQKFVASLLQASENTQFIIGTHAPMIIAGHDEYCWELEA